MVVNYFFTEFSSFSNAAEFAATVFSGPVNLKNTPPSGPSTIAPSRRYPGLMIFSVIPWSSVLGGHAGPADYYSTHKVAGMRPFWFELNWWFPQLAMLFIIASILVGVVAKIHEKELVRLIAAGASDMMGPALVVLLAEDIPNFTKFETAWVQYQFVAYDKAFGRVATSDVYSDIVLSACHS